jgi:tRNA threonylcarbamoyladenosine biosynthesis protein TsaE
LYLKLLVFLFLLSKSGFGHAHIFIDYSLQAVFDDTSLVGTQVSWVFDRMFSATIMKEFDKNKDGQFDKKEVNLINQKSFRNLAKSNYFTVIKIGKKPVPVQEPKFFNAEIVQGKKAVKYSFFLPFHLRAGKQTQKVSVHFFDPVIYIAFTIMKKDLFLSNPSGSVVAQVKLKREKYLNCPVITFKSSS